MVAGAVLAAVLIVGLGALGWIERRATAGHPIRLPTLPRIAVDLPLHGRAVLVGDGDVPGLGCSHGMFLATGADVIQGNIRP